MKNKQKAHELKQEQNEETILTSEAFKEACRKIAKGTKPRTACIVAGVEWSIVHNAIQANKDGGATSVQNSIARWIDRALAVQDEDLTQRWLNGGEKGRASESFLKATRRQYNVSTRMMVEAELKTLIAIAKKTICPDCFDKLAETIVKMNSEELAIMSDDLE